MRFLGQFALPLVCLALCGPFGQAQQLPAPSGPAGPRLVLLRNGETLMGEVAQEGDRYVVTLAAGQIRLKQSDVQCLCDDLAEAHAVLDAQVRPQDAAAQIRLAQWCLKQALHAEAAAHLDRAPDDPRAAMLRRQLDLLSERPAIARRVATDEPPADKPVEAVLGGLNAGVMENFVTSVQPLLLNQCASGACHGARSEQSWKLVRVSNGRARSRRLTLRNLDACLQMIDRQSPHASLLLARAAAAHGEAAQPLRESQYQLLVEWVRRAAQSEKVQPKSVADRGAAPASELPLPLPPPPGAPPRTSAALTALRQRPPAAATTSDNQADPLDPAAFNRRFVKPAVPDAETPASETDDADSDEASDL